MSSLTFGPGCASIMTIRQTAMELKQRRNTLALTGHYKLSEEDRLVLSRMKSEQEAKEIYIASGNRNVTPDYVRDYEFLLHKSNEFKRRLLTEAGELDEEMFNYTYYFDSVAGYIWFEEDE